MALVDAALTLAGELTLTGGDSGGEYMAGASALVLSDSMVLTLADDLDLTCVGGNGTSAGGNGVGRVMPANITGTLSKGCFKGGTGSSKGKALGEGISFPLAEGAGYFEPGEDREYYFDRGEAVPQVLEVREVAQNIRVDYIEGETTVSRYFENPTDMFTYYDHDFGGKDIQLLNDVQGNLDGIKGSFTLNGNGNTLKRDGSNTSLLKLKDDDVTASVTLGNVTLDGTFDVFPPSASSFPEVLAGYEGQNITLDEGATAANGGKVVAPPPDPPAEPPNILPRGSVCMDGGTLKLKAGSSVRENLGEDAGGVSLDYGATMTMEGAAITGNLGMIGPGGVWVGENCTFTMDAGEIAGNSSLTEEYAGGVSVERDGVFTMDDGTISRNTGIVAGGVTVKGTFIMNGGSVTGNRAAMPAVPGYWLGQYENLDEEILAGMEAWVPMFAVAGGAVSMEGGQVFLSGDTTIKDNTLWDGTPSNLMLAGFTDGADTTQPKPAIVTGALTGSIGVSLALLMEDEDTGVMRPLPTTGVVARGGTAEETGGDAYILTERDLAAFFSDNPDYELKLDTGTNTITLASRGVAAVGDRYYPTVEEALAAAADGQTVRLLQNTVLQETLVINKKVTLDLNGCTLTAGAGEDAIQVTTGGVLTLHDDSGTGEVVGGTGQCAGVSVENGGKLILSGKVRVTGGANVDGAGGRGVDCLRGATFALALGAEPVLTGGESESDTGGAGLYLNDGSAVDGLLTGGVYIGGNAGFGLVVMWVDADIRPLLSGGRYEGINMGGVMNKSLPALLPDYCYYANEDGDKLDEQPSGSSTDATVTVARRGGPVRDIYEFQAALGGAEFARINAGTGTVVLEGDVALAAPVEIAAGSYTLDLYGYSITGAPGVSGGGTSANTDGLPALVLNGAGVALTVMDSEFDEEYPGAITGGAAGTYGKNEEVYAGMGGTGILVEAGALTVTGDAHVAGGVGGTRGETRGTGGAGVRVKDGSLTLTGASSVTGGAGSSNGGDGILVDEEGTLRVPEGASPTVAGGAGSSELTRGEGVRLKGTAQIAGGSYSGSCGIVMANGANDMSGELTLTGGSFTGSSRFGGEFSGYRSLAISGGAFQGATGMADIMIMPYKTAAYKHILSGGSFLGERAIEMYRASPTDAGIDRTATPADLLAEGYRFYDGDGAVVEDLSGTEEDNSLILSGPVTVGAARWTEFTDTGWYDGHEADETYTLNTAKELAGLAELVNGGNSFGSKTVKLGADIDLSAHDWVPIGGNVGMFFGEFDGQGHAITGMNVTGNWECAGLFGAVGGGRLHDLDLSGNVSVARTSGAALVGGLAGSVSGISEVYNVLFTGTVSLDGKNGLVGGLVGEMEASGTALRNCAALAAVSGGFAASPGYSRNANVVYAGGLVGGISAYRGETGAVINNCYAAGTVAARPGARFVWCGALVGNAMGADEKTDHLYYLDTMGNAVSDGTLTNAPTAMTQADMQSAAFADTLNAWVDAQDEGAGYAKWYAHAGAYPDFTKSGGGSTGGTSGSGTTTTKTETNPDGSKTTTVTDKKTGAVTETTRAENGVEAVVKTEKNGAVTAAVTVPQEALTPPEEGPLPVVEVPGRALPTGEGAPAIVVTLPDGLDTAVIVAIPVADGTVVLRGDGTPIALSVVEDGRAYVVLDGSEELNIVTAGGFFDDVAGAAGEAADFGAARALWTGTGEREFSPEMPMDRAMLATVLWRLDGAEDPGSVELFPDVPEGAWFADAVAWGGKSGVIQGTGAGFAPDVALTAEQMLVMLYRYTTYADLLVPAADGTGVQAPEGTASWAADAIAWAINAGLVRLGEDGDLTAPITRAEAAALLQGYVQYLVKR